MINIGTVGQLNEVQSGLSVAPVPLAQSRPSRARPPARVNRRRLNNEPTALRASSVSVTDHKQAEIDYPAAIGEEGRAWLRNKPFHHDPRMTSRLLIDFGHVLQILDLHAGMSLVELGCGSGWMTRFAARHGLDAHGYDISPEMIAIARELAEQEGVDAKFEVADME